MPFLRRLRQPTLIMSGDDDPIIPLANAKMMHRLIRGSRLHIFQGGHLGLVAEAAELAPVVQGFWLRTRRNNALSYRIRSDRVEPGSWVVFRRPGLAGNGVAEVRRARSRCAVIISLRAAPCRDESRDRASANRAPESFINGFVLTLKGLPLGR